MLETMETCEAQLQITVERDYDARPNNQVRRMSAYETEAFDAWTMRALVLDTPPGFSPASIRLHNGWPIYNNWRNILTDRWR